jgi:hypothetical protein
VRKFGGGKADGGGVRVRDADRIRGGWGAEGPPGIDTDVILDIAPDGGDNGPLG